MNIYEKLLSIQDKLKAPKSQFNSFGKYNYRNCEDILEAVKPLCMEQKAVLFIKDKIIYIEGRFYVEATATLVNIEKPDEIIEVTASAREEDNKKGMDGSQVTGASSSYARKYALNGMFDIDDTKDADTDEHKKITSPDNKKTNQKGPQKPQSNNKQEEVVNKIKQEIQKITPGTIKQIEILAKRFADVSGKTVDDVMAVLKEKYNFQDINQLTDENGHILCDKLVDWNRQSAMRTRKTG